MSGVLLAGIIYPPVLSLNGVIFIMACLLPVKMFVFWISLSATYKNKMGFYGVLNRCLRVNIPSSLWEISFLITFPQGILMFPLTFPLSVIGEAAIVHHLIELGKWNRNACSYSLIKNLISFALLIVLFIPASINYFMHLNPAYLVHFEKSLSNSLEKLLRYEEKFYLENNQFHKNPPKIIYASSDTYNLLTKGYKLEFFADSEMFTVRLMPKRASLKSYAGAVFVIEKKPAKKFMKRICSREAFAIAPPPTPQLNNTKIGLKIQCPPDSLFLY